MTINIFDIKGTIINKKLYNLIPYSNNQINLSFLRKFAVGIYFLKIRLGGQEFVEKVILVD